MEQDFTISFTLPANFYQLEVRYYGWSRTYGYPPTGLGIRGYTISQQTWLNVPVANPLACVSAVHAASQCVGSYFMHKHAQGSASHLYSFAVGWRGSKPRDRGSCDPCVALLQ